MLFVSFPLVAQQYYNSQSSGQTGFGGDQSSGAPYIAKRDNSGRSSGGTAPLNLRSYLSPNKSQSRDSEQAEIVPFGSKPQVASSPYAMTTEEIIRERERINRELIEAQEKAQRDYEDRIRANAVESAFDSYERERQLIEDDPLLAASLGLGDDSNLSDRIDGLLAEIQGEDGGRANNSNRNAINDTAVGFDRGETAPKKRRKTIYKKTIYNKPSSQSTAEPRRSFSSTGR